MAPPWAADGASKRTSRVFLRVRVGGQFPSLDVPATKVELLLRPMLRPSLVEPVDGILSLDPELSVFSTFDQGVFKTFDQADGQGRATRFTYLS